MSGYKQLTRGQEAILGAFPMPDDEDRKAVNALFKPYIFYEEDKAGRWLRTSCCNAGRERFDRFQRTMDSAFYSLFGKHNDMAICPWCGREARLKNVNRLGTRKALEEHIPVVFLKEKSGDLYAQAYWAWKNYKDGLTNPPLYMLTTAYHFTPGRAEAYWQDWDNKWRVETLEGNYDPVHRVIKEPFVHGGYMNTRYCPYTVIGADAIERSKFRYCQYETFWQHRTESELHTDLMKYLAAYCIYPRHIEMLMKAGPQDLVYELIEGRRKNADIIKWAVCDPLKAFGLDKQEFNTFMSSGQDIEVLRVYKYMKKHGMKRSFADAENIEACLRYDALPFLKLCKKYKLAAMQTLRYLDKHTGPRCYGGYFTVHNAYILWRDYLNAADAIGYDMQNDVVLRPKFLDAAHNEATGEHSRRLETQRSAEREKKNAAEKQRLLELEAKYREVLETRKKTYNFSTGRYFIRVAETADEIIDEGKALQHCVGGYAQRHVEGKLTICFLRSVDKPDTPLCTIEMSTDRKMVQIHGYKNERDGAPDPRMVYAEILDPWLKWVAVGSRRDGEGNPVLPKEKKTKKIKEVAAA